MKNLDNICSFDSTRLKIIFIGMGIFPKRIAGDKNFILDLSLLLCKKGVDVQLISIAEPDPSINESKYIIDNNIKIHFIPRVLHFRQKQYHWYDNQGQLIAYHHHHSPLRDFIELSLTIAFNSKYLKSLVSPSDYTIVHWVDLSVVLPFLRLAFGKQVCLVDSILGYVPQRNLLNATRIRALNFADAIITGTSALKNILIARGCSCSIIEPLSWGSVNKYIKNRTRSKQKHQETKKTRFLWAGIIQQIGIQDFYKAYGIAKYVCSRQKDVEFTFSFKPESFKERYSNLSTSSIHIQKGDATFIHKLQFYDAFFSPIIRMDSSLAPPLTWIEALSAGLPIITTRCLGIDEIITHNVSGMIFDSWKKMARWLRHSDLKEHLAKMRIAARNEFLAKYDIEKVHRQYLDIYKKVWMMRTKKMSL